MTLSTNIKAKQLPFEQISARQSPTRQEKEFLSLADSFIAKKLGSFEDLTAIVNRFDKSKVIRSIKNIVQKGLADADPLNAFVEALKTKNPQKISTILERTAEISDPNVFKAFWRFVPTLITRSKTDSDLELQIDSKLIIAKRYVEETNNFDVIPNLADETAIVLSFSQEPAFDLKVIKEIEGVNKQLKKKLHEIYKEHAYIIDPRWVGSKKYSDEECDLLHRFGTMEKPVTLSAQETVISLLKSIDKKYHEGLLSLFESCISDQAAQRGCTGLFQIIITDSANASDYMALLTDFRKFSGAELERTTNMLKEIMTYDASHISELTKILKNRDFQKLEEFRYRVELRSERRKTPEKDLNSVRSAFLTAEHQDSEPPKVAALNRAFNLYDRILKESNQYLELDQETLTKKVMELRHWHGPRWDNTLKDELNDQYKVTFFALARNLFERRYGIYPYNTQMLSILMLSDEHSLTDDHAKGMYAQIKTGEGKSLLFAITAAYYASRGLPSDIITSNDYLAGRDAIKFKDFFKDFGLNSSTFTYHQPQQNTDIVYSTSSDLIFEFLQCKISNKPFFLKNRFSVALVDESDSLCIDEARQSCRIGHRGSAVFSKYQLDRFISFADNNHHLINRSLLESAKQFQRENGFACNLDLTCIAAYLCSARSSRHMKNGVDFVWTKIVQSSAFGDVTSWKASPVDVDNTGRIQHSSEWNDGLSQMILIRHNLSPDKPLLSIAQMSHPAFLKKYQRLICISGTMGDQIDRQMTRKLYSLTGFDVPPHHSSKRVDFQPEVIMEEPKWLTRIQEEVYNAVKANRAILIITQSINESKKVLEHLKAYHYKAQLLNDCENLNTKGEPTEEEALIHLAGSPRMITVATSVAGRGADITPVQSVIDAGGLLSLTTFIPDNIRVEFQARGRSGRQGKPGESKIIACLKTDPLLSYLSNNDKTALISTIEAHGPQSKEVATAIDFLRKVQNIKRSTLREEQMKLDDVMLTALEGYFQRSTDFQRLWIRHFGSSGDLEKKTDLIKNFWAESFNNLRIKLQYYDEIYSERQHVSFARPSPLLRSVFNRAFSSDDAAATRFSRSLYDAEIVIEKRLNTSSPQKIEDLQREVSNTLKKLDAFIAKQFNDYKEHLELSELNKLEKYKPVLAAKSKELPALSSSTNEAFNLGSELQNFLLEQMSTLRDVSKVGKVSYVVSYLRDRLGFETLVTEDELEMIKEAILNYARAPTPRMHSEIANFIADRLIERRSANQSYV